MHLTHEQRTQAVRRIQHFVEMANSIYGKSMPVPVVQFDLKGTTAGQAFGSMRIRLNEGLMVDHWDDFMNDTIPHEVAHCVVNFIWGSDVRMTRTGRVRRVSHGPAWKKVMRAFGVEPTRCHDMDVSKVRQARRTKTKYEYQCSCCGSKIPVGPKYHKDIQNGRKMRHKGCPAGSHLVWTGVLGRVTYAEAAQGKKAEPKKAPAKAAEKVSKAPRTGSQIAHAVEIYKAMTVNVDTHYTRQDIIKAIMNSMQVDKLKASGLHDRAKKKVAV
jgi:SprT protein